MHAIIKYILLGFLSLSLVTILGCKKAEDASTQMGADVAAEIKAPIEEAKQATEAAAEQAQAELKAAEETAIDAVQAARDAAAAAK